MGLFLPAYVIAAKCVLLNRHVFAVLSSFGLTKMRNNRAYGWRWGLDIPLLVNKCRDALLCRHFEVVRNNWRVGRFMVIVAEHNDSVVGKKVVFPNLLPACRLLAGVSWCYWRFGR